MILFVCEVFPIAALTNEVGNCAAAEVPAVSASITFVTCITSETPRDDVPVIGAWTECPAVSLVFNWVVLAFVPVPSPPPSRRTVLLPMLVAAEIAVAFTLDIDLPCLPTRSTVA